MRAAAAWLGARPQLGQDVFARGAPEDLTEIDRSRLPLDLTGLVRAYLCRRCAAARRPRHLPAAPADAVDGAGRAAPAGARCSAACPTGPAWSSFLPELLGSPLERRAALASTLIASLEMARGGRACGCARRTAFGPILVRRGAGETEVPA